MAGGDLNHPRWEYLSYVEGDLYRMREYPLNQLCRCLPQGMAVVTDVDDVRARSRHGRGKAP